MPNSQAWLKAHWAAPPSVIAGTTTRHDNWRLAADGTAGDLGFNLGLKAGEEPHRVDSARARLGQMLAQEIATLGNPPHLHWLDQVHGNRCVYADGQWASEPHADALWTDQPGIGLAIQSADCVPILLASRESAPRCIGAAHGGWRGLLAGVIEQLVAALPAAPSQLCAWIGPCISQSQFEVGEDVWRAVAKVSSSSIAEHPTDASKRLVDLPQLAEHRLRSCGVQTVAQSGLCSYTNPDFYSHRQAVHLGGIGAQTGRMASVVCMTSWPAR